MPKQISLVGSTGSIGRQTVEVVLANSEHMQVAAIGANSSVDLLVEQAKLLNPRVVAIADESKAPELKAQIPANIEVRAGQEALVSLVGEAEVVVNAVVGFAGLPITLETLQQGKRLALANKESLIAAGPLVQKVRNTPGAELIPVDSEHAALHQCLRSGTSAEVERLVLTASGGPFRGYSLEQLANVTTEQALTHPTWNMGPKITIDSSTLFNKGLEVIEAHELFGLSYDQIEVTVHPQSIIHSAVEFTDGSSIAQMSYPDMRLPIGYAIGYPDRLQTPYGKLDWQGLGTLTFESPNTEVFRCLSLAYEAGRAGGTAPTWLNAANEVAVEGFLSQEVTWLEIASIIESTLNAYDGVFPESTQVVIEADAKAREWAYKEMKKRSHKNA